MASWLRAGVRDLDPGCFALVMATGIVAAAMRLGGQRHLAGLLLGASVAGYLVLAAAYAARLAWFRRELAADMGDPRRAFGFFTVVAASDVISAGLAGDGHVTAAAVLLAVAGASWVLLSCSVPLLLAGRPSLAGANGTWFLWVVGAESVAVAAVSLRRPAPAALAALAICCWAVGVVLYLIVAGLVAVALMSVPVRPAEVTPPYWVFMGATAITVLAGGLLLGTPAGRLGGAVRGALAGLSVILWAFGTWLVPLLVVTGIWRHLVRGVSLRYEPGMWSIVFPVGMYGVGSRALGDAAGVSWMVTLGRYEAWLALAAWAVVALAMAASLARAAACPSGRGPGTMAPGDRSSSSPR